MKKINVTLISALLISGSTYAHRIAGDAGHNADWNWNTGSHGSQTTHAPVAKSTNVIRGMKGLDGLAKAGECYVSAYVEPVCKVEGKKVLVREAYSDMKIIPAVTEERDVTVVISPAKTIEEYVPALYENVGKKVLIAEATTEWKKGDFTGVTKSVDGETYCLVNVPAKYETQIEKVLKIPATTKIRNVKAVTRIVKKRVIIIPEKTEILKSYPAAYKTVEACVSKEAGRYEWVSVLCSQNARTATLTEFEKALATKGYLANSEVDGTITDNTVSAIKSYQRKNGLKVDGLVNIDIVKALGITHTGK